MIHKARLVVTVLFDDSDLEPGYFQEASLSDIERLMDQEAIGAVAIESIERVEPDKVRNELLEIGNDGEFFNLFD